MISLYTVSLLWFGGSPSLPLRCAKVTLRVFNYRLTSSMKIVSSERDNNRLYMESWHFWKALYLFFWRHNFWMAVYFSVSFFIYLFSPILWHQSTFRYFCSGGIDVRTWISILPSDYIFFQYHLLLLNYFHILSLHLLNKDGGSFPHSDIHCSLEENLPDEYLLLFALRKIIGLSVLVSCNSIVATVRCDILLVSSSLDPEDTWMKASHAWVLVVNSVGMRGGSLILTKLSLMNFLDDTLKVSHAFTNIDLICWGKQFVILYFRIHTYFTSL